MCHTMLYIILYITITRMDIVTHVTGPHPASIDNSPFEVNIVCNEQSFCIVLDFRVLCSKAPDGSHRRERLLCNYVSIGICILDELTVFLRQRKEKPYKNSNRYYCMHIPNL